MHLASLKRGESQKAGAGDYEALQALLEPDLALIARDAAQLGVGQVGGDLASLLDQVNEKAVEWASKHAGQLVTQLDETTRDLVRTLTETAIEEGWSNDKLADELEDSEAFSEMRSNRIARTETAFADIEGNLIGWRESGLVESKQWILGNGSCEECQALGDEIVGLDDPFSDGTLAPPHHPNCACDVVPITKDDE